MLPEVISGTIGLLDLVSPLRRLLPRDRDSTSGRSSRSICRSAPSPPAWFLPHPHVIEYDHLVSPSARSPTSGGLRGLPEHALPFKNLTMRCICVTTSIRALEEAAMSATTRSCGGKC